MPRHDGRAPDELRPVKITRAFTSATPGSVLYASGRTKVLVTASVEERVPPWMQGRGQGWLTAEYSMLPGSTGDRKARASTTNRVDGRTHEIQRLVGRSLRSVLDAQALGERTLWIDCDVLEADGGTRTASVTGGYVAARIAVERLAQRGLVDRAAILAPIAAVSVGVVGGQPFLDLDYPLDSRADVDMNVVMDGEGRYIEVQGTGERRAMSRPELDALLALAEGGIRQLFTLQDEAVARAR